MQYEYLSPFGYLVYEIEDNFLVGMSFSDSKRCVAFDLLNQKLDDYFKYGKNIVFPIKFKAGTIFQKQVWETLLKIPFGETKTYKDVAIMINRPNAFRAVGQACKKNSIGLVVPCHRVIGSDGKMCGYSGKKYIELKQSLIDFEKGFKHAL